MSVPLRAVGGDPVRELADRLSADGALKLWSVLVTCLGDLSQSGQDEASGLVLSAIVDRIGLQPQAMRVALHRLKRDGWVDSRRTGRVGYHRLSQSGLRQTKAAAARIYGPAQHAAGWQLVGLPPDAPDGLSLLPDSVAAIPISRSFAMVTGPVEDLPEEWLVCAPGDRSLPGWVRNLLEEAACEMAFAALEHNIARIDTVPQDPLGRLALRVLVLHGWRRLILRSNPVAEAALGPERAEITCRDRVQEMLRTIGPPSIQMDQVAS